MFTKKTISKNDFEVYGIAKFGRYVVLYLGDDYKSKGFTYQYLVAIDPSLEKSENGDIVAGVSGLSGALKYAACSSLNDKETLQWLHQDDPKYRWDLVEGAVIQ